MKKLSVLHPVNWYGYIRAMVKKHSGGNSVVLLSMLSLPLPSGISVAAITSPETAFG